MKLYSRSNYKQCHLVKGAIHQTAWLPLKFAEVGKVLSLNGDNGWEVTEVYSHQLKIEEIEQNLPMRRHMQIVIGD